MTTTKDILAAWEARLTKAARRFVVRKGIQFAVNAIELRRVLKEGCPPELRRIKRRLDKGRLPTHVLLTPFQLNALITHDPENDKQPADVPGLRQPTKAVDGQADASTV